MKELFRSCFLVVFAGGCAVSFLVIAFIVCLECSSRTPPKNYYKKSLEFVTKDALPSFKIVKQKYSEEQYAMAIIKLSESDYQKVLYKVKSDSSAYFIITKSPFSSVHPLGFELEELMQKANITENNIAIKYEYHRKALGFVPPNKIVYNENLR